MQGARILVLSDRDCGAEDAPIPSLLLVSAVHQHLIAEGARTEVMPSSCARRKLSMVPMPGSSSVVSRACFTTAATAPIHSSSVCAPGP